MLNQIVIVGRIKELKENKDNLEVTLAVIRSYKNDSGIYETDFIPCILKGSLAKSILEYCEVSDLVGVKGRLEVNEGKIAVIVDKVTYLSSNKKESE